MEIDWEDPLELLSVEGYVVTVSFSKKGVCKVDFSDEVERNTYLGKTIKSNWDSIRLDQDSGALTWDAEGIHGCVDYAPEWLYENAQPLTT